MSHGATYLEAATATVEQCFVLWEKPESWYEGHELQDKLICGATFAFA